MHVSSAITCLNKYLDTGLPAFLWGPPGVGKSDIVRHVAKSREASLIDLRAITFDPVDLRGLPSVVEGRAHWCLPEFLPDTNRDGETGVLFLDELNAAPQSVQAACFQLVLDRRIGNYELPKGWMIVGAGNRQSDGAAAQKMPTALANRFAHIDIDVDHQEWCKWAETEKVADSVIGFIRFRPTFLHDMKVSPDLRAFPTPRAWVSVSRVLGTDEDIDLDLVQGIVGTGAAMEFVAFHKTWRTLPSIEEILDNPSSTRLPENLSEKTAICELMIPNATPSTFPNLLEYARRMNTELTARFAMGAIDNCHEIAKTQAYMEWAGEAAEGIKYNIPDDKKELLTSTSISRVVTYHK